MNIFWPTLRASVRYLKRFLTVVIFILYMHNAIFNEQYFVYFFFNTIFFFYFVIIRRYYNLINTVTTLITRICIYYILSTYKNKPKRSVKKTIRVVQLNLFIYCRLWQKKKSLSDVFSKQKEIQNFEIASSISASTTTSERW